MAAGLATDDGVDDCDGVFASSPGTRTLAAWALVVVIRKRHKIKEWHGRIGNLREKRWIRKHINDGGPIQQSPV